MSSKPEFGTFAYHQPNYEGFVKLGKQHDFIFQSLAHLGGAAHQMSWALNVLEYTDKVPQEIEAEIHNVMQSIQNLQESLRAVAKKE
ncbi:hypothetical protein IAQ67_28820 (plasmid) [Paenibacillus peoriae]|uniref:Uncharacterized protein n=1 Tax=Paenibacillus peoriae TaxID=59893 RepID=A0A7H0YH03_9BACL|nr:hypothetical protein [Paenibacillus peoriae]QNR70361.1 hypothetical protein IAQ67_28820 [Paenibacillus peoriae]